jgi:uncharacterized protein YndB with AHSA1/START domain
MTDSTGLQGAAAAQVGDELKATIVIDVPPAQVWAAITDLPRMAAWSPQVAGTLVLGGPVRSGTRFVNLNHQGWKRWPTNGKVVRFAPHTDFAFVIAENGAVWSFQLEPTADGGTLLTQRRELPKGGTSLLSKTLVATFLGGQTVFVADLLEGMAQTLERLKAELEG